MSAMVSVADRAPEAVGVNVILMVQLALAAKLAPQLLVCAKSPLLTPAMLMLVRLNAAVPLLVSVTAWAALPIPTDWLPNAIDVGESVAAGAPPVPERTSVCGLPGASSAITSVADRVPAAVGVNVTLMVQLEFGAMVAPQAFVDGKSLLFTPPMVMLDRFSGAPPVFVSVTVCAALAVPTDWLEKASALGASDTDAGLEVAGANTTSTQ